MGIFIIGIVLLVILFRCSIKWEWKESTFVELFVGILIIIMILEILIPGRDIGREFVSQTELVSLSDGKSVSGGGGLFYVRVNSENSYSYYYEIDSDYKQTSQEKSYKQGTVTGNDVIIIEYENMKI
ncbi:MAG: hypothetical protein IJ220_03115 [Clostridia bacterium]|nr:hypothetical protein [Clostridia bacterium]